MIHELKFSTDIIGTWIRTGGRTLVDCVCELVDNSCDSAAKQISIEMDQNTISIDDDGGGFSGTVEQGTAKFFTYGASVGAKERIGRYGIGLKEAAPWLATWIELTSGNGSEALHIIANWDRMLKERTFKFDTAELLTVPRIGTHILLRNIRHGRVTPQKKKQLKLELQKSYAPGLRQGLIAIHFRDGPGEPQQLTASPRPALIDRREFVGYFRSKEFRAVCGLLADRKANHEFSGWHFSYGARVVKSDRAKLSGFYGEAILVQRKTGRDWKLNRHKTDFDERPDLIDHLAKVPEVQELITALNQNARTIELEKIAANVTRIMQSILAPEPETIKQKRPGPHVKDGTIVPKDGKRILDDAAIVDEAESGNVRRQRKPKPPKELGHFQPEVRWVNWLPSQPIGECQLDRHRADISINENHPWFKENRDERGMMCIAMVLFAEAASRFDGMQQLMHLVSRDLTDTHDVSKATVSLLSYLLNCVHVQYPVVMAAVGQ
jgi:hypothetical protein